MRRTADISEQTRKKIETILKNASEDVSEILVSDFSKDTNVILGNLVLSVDVYRGPASYHSYIGTVEKTTNIKVPIDAHVRADAPL